MARSSLIHADLPLRSDRATFHTVRTHGVLCPLIQRVVTLLILIYVGTATAEVQAQQSEGEAVHLETEESIRNRVHDFLEPRLQQLKRGRVSLDIGNIDPRLRLQKCTHPPELEQIGRNNIAGKISLKVSCRSPLWGIFVPVTIQTFEPVVVARATLPRGTIISPQLLMLREEETSALNYGFFTRIDQVAGTEATRPIQANSVVFSHMVEPLDTIRKGDEVIIQAQAGSLSVRMKGLALQDGALGEQIQVRNLQSQRIIRAIVAGPGRVMVPM